MDKSDHRHIGQQLDLFHFQEEAPGMVFWHAPGLILYRILEEAARHRFAIDGYEEVRAPQLLRQPIWEKSGHWQHFQDGMFLLDDEPERRAAMKPVGCPGHIQIFQHASRSFRNLPMRIAELGLVHRKEASGTLHGLFRLRQFTQDDGHIFCAEEHVEGEVVRFCASVLAIYEAFGFSQIDVALSTRPEERFGDDSAWDRSETLLGEAARRAGLAYREQPGAGAFYGPKLEFVLRDRVGREWQCGTIQLDFAMPERFEIEYVDSGGARARPVMLHRAIYGSLERFLGIVLEHHAGSLPAWLAPTQVVIAPVAPAHQSYAAEVRSLLAAEGIRVRLDDRPESLARRIKDAHDAGVSHVIVVGDRESRARSVNLRSEGQSRELAIAPLIDRMRSACAVPWNVAASSRACRPEARGRSSPDEP